MLSAECRHLTLCWWHDHWPLSILTSVTSDNAAPGVVTSLLLLLSLLLLWKPSSEKELGLASDSQSERSIEAADQSQDWHSSPRPWEDWGQQQPHPQPGLNIMNRFIITSFITTNVPWTNFAFASLEITRKISKMTSLYKIKCLIRVYIYIYMYGTII